MSLHRLAHVVMGVPNVAQTEDFYTDFGLSRQPGGNFSSRDGGDQLRIVQAQHRRIVELGVAADDHDDLARIDSNLRRLGFQTDMLLGEDGGVLLTRDPILDMAVRISVRPRLSQPRVESTPYNGPGRIDRLGRAPGVVRQGPVRPRRLGHAVAGTTDLAATMRFFVDGLGFKVSDYIGGHGAFMRCSDDHHNFLALQSPVNYLHHTSWQVDDVDEVGRGAFAMLEGNPERHVWGLGRHHAGSNFFWYLKDPAGNFSEYFSDMDCIPEDDLWEPDVLEGVRGLFEWGPPPPPSFLDPEDLAALMTGAHSKA